jgi:LysM repeat protein
MLTYSNILSAARHFSFLVLLITLPVNGFSQEPGDMIEKSKERVLIDGRVYFIHVVKPGETLYAISRAYGVSPKTLSKENPSIIIGLQPGQVLKIPEKDEAEFQDDGPGAFTYHRLQEGETIYSLSRQYELDVDEILVANPGISIDDIPAGTVIRIPQAKFYTERESFTTQDQEYFIYVISEDESFPSVARKFDLNVRELRRLNRDQPRILQEGDTIRLPRTSQTTAYFEQRWIPDEELLLETPPRCAVTIPDHFDDQLNVALLLPLYLDENEEREYIDSSQINAQGDPIYRIVQRDADWIYPRSIRFLEFYEGVLMAIDSLRNRGMSVELFVYDTEQDPSRVREIAMQEPLDEMDLIIGPVYSMNLEILLEALDDEDIPVISPFVQRADMLAGIPNLFEVVPDHQVELEYLAKAVSREYGKNIVLIHPGDSLELDEVELFKWMLLDSLGQYGSLQNIILKEVVFYEERPRHDTINEIKHAFLEAEPNIVVVLSEKETFVSEVLAKLNTLSQDFELKIYGFPEWLHFRNIQLDYFHGMDVYLCSPYFLDYNQPQVKAFLRKYRSKFQTEPVPYSFAWNGFDITYYFITAIAVLDDRFYDCVQDFNMDLLISEFKFEKMSFRSGAMNRGLRFLHFTKDYRVEEVPLPRRPRSKFDFWFRWDR